MWASQLWKYTKPRTWLNSGGLGTMGYAIPAAIGAKLGLPDQLVYAIDGDGCFQMTQEELTTASTEAIPIKIAVSTTTTWAWCASGRAVVQRSVPPGTELTDHTPDFVKLAEAMGCVGCGPRPRELGPAIEKSLTINDRPVVVEFKVDPDEMVFPMVPAGGSNDVVAMSVEDMQ